MKQVDISWLAAVIDSEGAVCITASRRYRSQVMDVYAVPFICISQNDRRLLEKVQKVVGFGRITRPRLNTLKTSIGQQWVVKGNRKVEAVLKTCLPYLIVKRAKAVDLLKCFAYYRKLLQEPLKDKARTTRALRASGKTTRAKRTQLANLGHRRFIRRLLVWLRKHQPDTAARRLCEEAVAAPWKSKHH